MLRRNFIQTLLIGSGGLVLGTAHGFEGVLDGNNILVKMIYNNIGHSKTLVSKWGLSIWIEDNYQAFLFDTGGDASVILDNINHSRIDLTKLKGIVISHNHWDHKNGLQKVLERTDYLPKVYVVENDVRLFKNEFPKAKIVSVKEPMQISSTFWTTGELDGTSRGIQLREQSFVISQGDSVYLFTGCSHTGIVPMTETVKSVFPEKSIKLISGGFHLGSASNKEGLSISKKLKELNVQKIAPSHCTGKSAMEIFKKDWGTNYLSFNLGEEIKIELS